ncbi:MAG: bifunctional adenosylcobinamide kinase/adenosylcobinamide-phosphate guanylyltransferase [Actinomycetota bacterium]|nr:bifunctional adenosylcobinamide kinase/adenosylcobinamide-phosphate guanylyltransferase [Actinomycetota bacterium]
MSLVFLTGGARSGKSSAAEALASRSQRDVSVIVFGRADDDEMSERIAKHKAVRPAGWRTVEAHDERALSAVIESDHCLVLDCLGTFLGRVMESELVAAGIDESFDSAVAPAGLEARIEARIVPFVESIIERDGRTVVVSNEVGSGVVPATWSGRVFRDLLGRANSRFTQHADESYLVVCGRCIDLGALPLARDLDWNTED